MNVTEFLKQNLVRGVRYIRSVDQWCVMLRCGGPGGYGDTVEAAVADARTQNANWLDAPWLEKVA